tara:strand:+ start:649 stop:1839 length:1191 start_codon:yes stop_codon:yes gene_type:complete
LWLCNIFSQGAAWGLIVARGWMVLEMSESSAMVGFVTFAAMAPLIIIPPFSGFLADRIDRKKIVGICMSINLIQNIVLGVLGIFGLLEVWHIVSLSFINGIARAAQMPATQALIPNLVPSNKLLNAISLNAMTQHAARLIGPGFIAPLMAESRLPEAFLICALLYFVGIVTLLKVRTVSTGIINKDESFLANIFSGLTYIYTNVQVLSLTTLVVLHCAMTMSYESVLPVLVRDQIELHALGISYLMMSVGAGSIFGVTILAGLESDIARGRSLLISGIFSGIAGIAIAFSPTITYAIFSAFILGASTSGFMAISHTMIQSIVPDAIRGRVTSMFVLHAGGIMAFMNLGNGYLADKFGPSPIMSIAAAGFLVMMVFSIMLPGWKPLYKGSISSTNNL